MAMLCDVAEWRPSNPESPCWCGQLSAGAELGLSDTSVPTERGLIAVTALRTAPPPAEGYSGKTQSCKIDSRSKLTQSHMSDGISETIDDK